MESIQRIEELIRQIEEVADPNVRATARELVQALMDFHGAGIERMMDLIAESGESGASIIGSIGRDELAGALLLLYSLHPEDLETRVRRAVSKMRNVELESTADGVVRVRIAGNGRAHPDRSAIEAAVYSAAPEAVSVVVEGIHEPGFVPLESLISVAR